MEGEFSQSNPQEDLVSNLVECDFILSSLLKDTVGHSLPLPCLEWEVPRELLLHRSELIPPPVLGFERFQENKYTSIKRRRMIVQFKEEDVEKNSYALTDRLKYNTLPQPVQGLGWVKILIVSNLYIKTII